MTQTFTPEELLLLLYKEAPAYDRLALEEALEEDYLLREEYDALRKAAEALPKVRMNAPRTCLNAVLNYSRATFAEPKG